MRNDTNLDVVLSFDAKVVLFQIVKIDGWFTVGEYFLFTIQPKINRQFLDLQLSNTLEKSPILLSA